MILDHLEYMLQYDYYHLLGVDKKATEEQITKGFRRQILKCHPDKNPDRKEESMNRSMQIVEAYHILKHKDLRLDYNKYLEQRNKKKQGHLEQFRINVPKGCNIQVQYQCEQCFGVTEVSLKINQLFSYIVSCSHCGLRTLISVNHIL